MTKRRAFDIALSLLVLAITLVPMLIMALAMCYDSQGYPLFRQRRVGQDGKTFWIYKIRTMRQNTESNGDEIENFAVNLEHPLITSVGRFLRRLHFDELPQLINILRGDMTFIGPRPMTEKAVAKRVRLTPRYAERHRVKPGLFGLAQFYGPEEALPRKHLDQLDLDLEYIQNQNLSLDIWIVYHTILFEFGGKPPHVEVVLNESMEAVLMAPRKAA